MKMTVEVGFNRPELVNDLGMVSYSHNVTADEDFSTTDFEAQAHALSVLNEEFKAVIRKVNDRLRAKGYDENSFRRSEPGQRTVAYLKVQ